MRSNKILFTFSLGFLLLTFFSYIVKAAPSVNNGGRTFGYYQVDGDNETKDRWFTLPGPAGQTYGYDVYSSVHSSDPGTFSVDICGFGSSGIVFCRTPYNTGFSAGFSSVIGSDTYSIDLGNLMSSYELTVHIRVDSSSHYGTGTNLTAYGRYVQMNSITASPNPITQGQGTTLSWDGVNVQDGGITISGSDGSSWSNLSLGQQISVSPSSTTTYTLRALGPTGSGPGYSYVSTTVTVNNPPPPGPGPFSMSGNAYCNPNGNNTIVDLNWAPATNASYYNITGNYGIPGGNGITGTSFEYFERKGVSLLYYVTAYNAYGWSQSNRLSLSACPAPSVTFSANPNTVAYNSTSTLSYSSTNSYVCSISGGSIGQSIAPNTSGQISTGNLTATTTYTFTCSDPDGGYASSRSITINVSQPPVPTVNFSASPTTLSWNNSGAILSWSSSDATSCTASGEWSGSVGTNGSRGTGALLVGTHNYILTCTGIGGSTSQNATVTVSPPTPNTPTNVIATEPDYCASGPAVTTNWTYSDPSGSPQNAYQVQITNTGNFNSPIYDSCTAQNTCASGNSSWSNFTGQGILQFNTTYKARVRTWNSYGVVSAWSGSSNSWKTPLYAFPQTDFSWTANGILNNPSPPLNKPVQFTDLTVFGGNPGGRIWGWVFGDGGSSATQNPTHTYITQGSYYTTLTATDSANQSCSRTKGPLIIQKPIPQWREVAPR